MLSGATWRAAAIAGTAVLRIVVSSDSIKNATATSHGSSRLLESDSGGCEESDSTRSGGLKFVRLGCIDLRDCDRQWSRLESQLSPSRAFISSRHVREVALSLFGWTCDRVTGNLKQHFIFPISAVSSMGRCNTCSKVSFMGFKVKAVRERRFEQHIILSGSD